MNSKQRVRWLSDQISELQRYLKKAKAERPQVTMAIAKLDEARQMVRSEGDSESGDEGEG